MCPKILIKLPIIKLHANLFSCSQGVKYSQAGAKLTDAFFASSIANTPVLFLEMCAKIKK